MTDNKLLKTEEIQDQTAPPAPQPKPEQTPETTEQEQPQEPAIEPEPVLNNIETIEQRIEELLDQLDAIDVTASDSKHIVPEDKRPKGKLTNFWLRYAGKDAKYYTEDSARLERRGGIGLFATVMMGSAAISAIAAPPIASAITHATQTPNSAGLTMLATFLGTLATAHGAFKFIDTTIVDGVRERKVADEILKEIKAMGDNISSQDTLAKKLEMASFSAQHAGSKATSGLSANTILKLRLGLIAGFAFLSTWKFLTEISEGAHITENLRLAHNQTFGDSNQSVLNEYEAEFLKRRAARVAAEQNLTGLHDVKNGVVGSVELSGPLLQQKDALMGDISGLEETLAKAKTKAEQFKTLFNKEVLGEKTTVEIDGVPYTTSGKQSQAIGGGYSGPQNKLFKGLVDRAEAEVRGIEAQITAKRTAISGLYDEAKTIEQGALASRKEGVESKITTAQEDIEIARKKELEYKDHESLAKADPRYKEFNQFEGRDSEMINILASKYGAIDWLKTAAIAGFVGTLELSAVIHAVTAQLNEGERNRMRHEDEKALRSVEATALKLEIAEMETRKKEILNEKAQEAARLARIETAEQTVIKKLAIENEALAQEGKLLEAKIPLADRKAQFSVRLEKAEEAERKAEQSLWDLQDARRGEQHAREQLLKAQDQVHKTIMGRLEAAKTADWTPEQRAYIDREAKRILDTATPSGPASNDNRNAETQMTLKREEPSPGV